MATALHYSDCQWLTVRLSAGLLEHRANVDVYAASGELFIIVYIYLLNLPDNLSSLQAINSQKLFMCANAVLNFLVMFGVNILPQVVYKHNVQISRTWVTVEPQVGKRVPNPTAVENIESIR